MISRDAFAQEVRALTDTAYAVTYLILGNSADCEDAMSAAILRAFENRGKLRKRDSFRAWFLQILRHEAYDLLKKRRRLTPVEELPEEAAPEGEAGPAAGAAGADRHPADGSAFTAGGVRHGRDRPDPGRARRDGEIPDLPG